MHSVTTMTKTRAIEHAMDIQALAARRISEDGDESKDYRSLAVLAANLETIAHRCIRRDEAENRDHAEMRTIARDICKLLEGLNIEMELTSVRPLNVRSI